MTSIVVVYRLFDIYCFCCAFGDQLFVVHSFSVFSSSRRKCVRSFIKSIYMAPLRVCLSSLGCFCVLLSWHGIDSMMDTCIAHYFCISKGTLAACWVQSHKIILLACNIMSSNIRLTCVHPYCATQHPDHSCQLCKTVLSAHDITYCSEFCHCKFSNSVFFLLKTAGWHLFLYIYFCI